MVSRVVMKRLMHLVWPPAVLAAVLAVWIGVNAFDEDLSPEAQAILALGEPTAGPLSEDNGFLWMTSLSAPAGEDPMAFARKHLEALRAGDKPPSSVSPIRLPPEASCKPEEKPCLPLSDADSQAVIAALNEAADREVRADRMRKSPLFAEVWGPAAVHAAMPDLRGVIYAQELAFARARLASRSGDWDGLLTVLEADMAFNRSVLEHTRHIVSKIVAARAIGRSALFAVQVWRNHGDQLERYQPRLAALATELSVKQLRLEPGFDLELAMIVRDLHLYGKNSMLRIGETTESEAGLRGQVEKAFFQPNATANLIVADAARQRPALTGVTRKFDDARKAIVWLPTNKAKEWYQYIALRNPVGRFLADASAMDYTPYQATLHDLQALLILTRARINLSAKPHHDEWLRLMTSAGWEDPFTGTSLAVDEELGQAAIAARRTPGWPKTMVDVTGGKLVGDQAL